MHICNCVIAGHCITLNELECDDFSITFQNHIMFCRTIISGVAHVQVENLPLQHHGAERKYANSVVKNDIDPTIDIFGRRNGRDTHFF